MLYPGPQPPLEGREVALLPQLGRQAVVLLRRVVEAAAGRVAAKSSADSSRRPRAVPVPRHHPSMDVDWFPRLQGLVGRGKDLLPVELVD